MTQLNEFIASLKKLVVRSDNSVTFQIIFFSCVTGLNKLFVSLKMSHILIKRFKEIIKNMY